MNRLRNSSMLVAALMMAPAGLVLAQEEETAATAAAAAAPAPAAASEIPVAEDLTAVIALQGQPCGKVVSAVKTGEDAYVATCQDSNRYRIFVNADGRVVVAKVE